MSNWPIEVSRGNPIATERKPPELPQWALNGLLALVDMNEFSTEQTHIQLNLISYKQFDMKE